MPLFKRKVKAIEARQFETNNEFDCKNMNEIVCWMNQGSLICNGWHNRTNIFVMRPTKIEVVVSNWIIKLNDDEFTVMTDEDFKQYYEEAKLI